MASKQKFLFSWSGGKDSVLALNELVKNQNYEIAALITTVSAEYNRVSMHGIRQVLIEQQAQALNLPVEVVLLPKNISTEEYESKMRDVMVKYKKTGVSAVGFGDIFLEDLKKYRRNKLAKVGLDAIFPIWKKDTKMLACEFIDMGFKAVITSVDSNALDGKCAGLNFDCNFLSELPESIDPCGENGEFHTFVYDGPIFNKSIPYKKGRIVLRENRFYFCDIIPVRENTRLMKI